MSCSAIKVGCSLSKAAIAWRMARNWSFGGRCWMIVFPSLGCFLFVFFSALAPFISLIKLFLSQSMGFSHFSFDSLPYFSVGSGEEWTSSYCVLSYWLGSTHHTSLNFPFISSGPSSCHAPLQRAWLCLLRHLLKTPDHPRDNALKLFQFIDVFYTLMTPNTGGYFRCKG